MKGRSGKGKKGKNEGRERIRRVREKEKRKEEERKRVDVIISEYIKLDTSTSVLRHILDLVNIHLSVILSEIKLNLP